MRLGRAVIILLLFISGTAMAQDTQSIMNDILRQREKQLRDESSATRSELERLDLKEQLRYRLMSKNQIMDEIAKYCRDINATCEALPPALSNEAVRRGLMKRVSRPQ